MKEKKYIDIQTRFQEKVGCMAVFEEIKFYSNRYRGELPTIETLAKKFNVHPQTISKKLVELASKDLLEFDKNFKYKKNYVLKNKN